MSETAPPPTATGVLAEPPAASPPATPGVGHNGGPEWLSALPEAMRADPVLSRYQDVAALAKGHIEAQGLIGRKGLVAPKEGDPPEVAQAWRQALGVPEKPEGYEIKLPDGTAPEHWNDDTTTVLRAWAHELGMTPAQAQGLAERYAGMLAKHETETVEATETELRKEWGAAYDRKVTAGQAAAREFLSDEARAALKAAGLGSNPHIIRALVKMGETIANHDGAAGMGSGAGALTPAEARRQAAELRAHPGYFDSRHPEHRHLVARAVDLEKMATVGQAA